MTFNLFSGAPQDQAMLALAAGLLEQGGPSRTPVSVGQGAARGMMSGQEALMRAQQAQQKEQLFKLQMAQAQQAQAEQAKRDAALGRIAQDPRFSGMGDILQIAPQFALEQALPKPRAPVVVGPGAALVDPQKPDAPLFQAPERPAKPSFELSDMTPEQARAFKLQQAEAGRNNITNIVGGQSAFFKAIGDKIGEGFAKRQEDAKAASNSLANIREGKTLLDQGVITGAGAEAVVSGGQILQRLGIPLGQDANATISNTQAFAATMGREVGNIIRLFGAGTGLSDADREYAQKIVGGQITLNEASIRRLFDINERLAIAKINAFNKEAEDILKTPQGQQFPRSALIVERPEAPSAKVPPKSGEVRQGWVFLGGDPANRMNWRKQ